MKVTLTFNLPDDKEEFDAAMNGSKHKEAWSKVFRPAWNHGYSHPKLKELSDRDFEVIEALSEIYSRAMDYE